MSQQSDSDMDDTSLETFNKKSRRRISRVSMSESDSDDKPLKQTRQTERPNDEGLNRGRTDVKGKGRTANRVNDLSASQLTGADSRMQDLSGSAPVKQTLPGKVRSILCIATYLTCE
jgi:hypothetical protein